MALSVRILIFTQYFSPEVGATQARLHAFAAGLAERGHEVEVVCEVPNHPQGIVHADFKRRVLRRRRVDGFTSSHVWVRTSPVKTLKSRIAFYASYAGMAGLYGCLAARPDVVFASSPPLPVGVAAASAAARHRVPWVLDVRDLWPDAAVAMGELSDPRMLRLAEWLERRLYASATAITAVTEPFKRAIETKPATNRKVSIIPNGTTQFWVDGADVEADRTAVGLPAEVFAWTFAGNIGVAQGLDTAIDAADQLGEEFHLLLLGDGPARQSLEARARERTDGRVEFRGQVAAEPARRVLRASDALLVSLAPDPVLGAFVPSKLFDFCAVGRPVVLAAVGEARRLAEESGAALCVAPGDSVALVQALRRLRDDASLRASLAEAGRRFGRAHLRDRGVGQLERLLERVTRREAPALSRLLDGTGKRASLR